MDPTAMDLYDVSSRASQRDIGDELIRIASRYEAVVKYFAALLLTIGAGFGLRIVYESYLGQVFGAMIIWFSLLFGLGGVALISLFAIRAKIADIRHADR